MDLISCRNLLIYLEPVLQGRVIPTFHYALKPDGVLLLGASETVGRHTDLFSPLDKRCRVYTKLPATAKIPRLTMPATPPVEAIKGRERPEPVPSEGTPESNTQAEADRLVLSRYGPAGVVVNETLEVVQFRGSTGPFLEPPSGKPSLNLLRMAREGLMLPLRSLTDRARLERRAVREDGVRYQFDGRPQTVNIEVVPLRA